MKPGCSTNTFLNSIKESVNHTFWNYIFFHCLSWQGSEKFKLSNSMTWWDQNGPTKGTYFAIILLLEKYVKFCNIFMNSYFICFGYNTAYITNYKEILFSQDQTVTHLITTLSLKMSSRCKINWGHCGQLNTVEYALSNHQKAGHPLSNNWTVGHTL